MPHFLNRKLIRILLVAAVSLWCEPFRVFAQETEVSGAQQQISEELDKSIRQLSSESYANREAALLTLEKYPAESIPRILDYLLPSPDVETTVSPEASLRMVRLLHGWLDDPTKSPGAEAFDALRKLSRSTSTLTSFRASTAIQDFTVRQSESATAKLRQLGVFIDTEYLQIVTSQAQHYLLRLDDSHRGTREELSNLRWLHNVEMVKLSGEIIDQQVLEHVVSLPNLKIIQLRNVSLTKDDIELLGNVKQLETLELLYTPIDASYLPALAELPVANNLRLFGTRLNAEEVDTLREQLDGVEIVFGNGGFLGIMSQDPSSTVVRSVTPGGAAELGGVKANDRLITIQGVPISKFDDLRNELGKFMAGDTIDIVLERPTTVIVPGKIPRVKWMEIEVKVTLGQQP